MIRMNRGKTRWYFMNHKRKPRIRLLFITIEWRGENLPYSPKDNVFYDHEQLNYVVCIYNLEQIDFFFHLPNLTLKTHKFELKWGKTKGSPLFGQQINFPD